MKNSEIADCLPVVALIPAYDPSEELIYIVSRLSTTAFSAIIVVNDGSRQECAPIFRRIEMIEKVTVLKHAVNLGKGAALKTGLNHAYCNFGGHAGVVTIDADGQHLPEDALRVAHLLKDNPERIVLGVRHFDTDIPLRSRVGNKITRNVYRFLIGQKLTDTQSGLRGIPMSFIPLLLKIGANGYEFELDMLLSCKYTGRRIIEEPIATVYIDGNISSHFNPLIDSMKIYFLLLRFALSSFSASIIDFIIFALVFNYSGDILKSIVLARVVAGNLNFFINRSLVFHYKGTIIPTLIRYYILFLVMGCLAYMSIGALSALGINVIVAKIFVESVLFIATFSIQRDFIFMRSDEI